MKLEGEIIVSNTSPGVFVAAKELDYVVGLAGLETFKAKGNRYKVVIFVPAVVVEGKAIDIARRAELMGKAQAVLDRLHQKTDCLDDEAVNLIDELAAELDGLPRGG